MLTRSLNINGIYERSHKTILQVFYQITFQEKINTDMDRLQTDLNEWLVHYYDQLRHQGKMCYGGRTPLARLEDGKSIMLAI